MGRVSVDLYPEQLGVPLAEVRSFSKSLGGSPTNVAVAVARLGRRAGVLTKVGADGFGPYVRSALRGFGVDDRWVGTDPVLRTPIVFCEMYPPDHFPLLFYREPSAPDMQLRAEELDLDLIGSVPVFWVTGTGLSAEPSRSATMAALEHRGRRHATVVDLDYRAGFWSHPGEASALLHQALRHASVAVGNLEEASIATGRKEPADAAAALCEAGVDLAVVKLGPRGVMARAGGETVVVAPLAVEVRNGLGAGDAFGGALCHAMLSGWDLDRTIRFANAAGALVASRMTCADDMPGQAEVEALLAEAPHG